MARILVTGGTGSLGSDIVAHLAQTPHIVRITSRKARANEPKREWAQVDFETQTDFSAVVQDVDVIVHCASNPLKNTYQTDVVGTQHLLAAAHRAQVKNFIFISIIGIDRIPYSYYKHKLSVEQSIKDSGVPYTITRMAQFHSFIDMFFSFTRRWPVMPVPMQWQAQTIDTREAAAYLLPFIEGEATGRTHSVAGPQVLRIGEMARQWRDGQGSHKPILPLPLFGAMARGFTQGHNTAPDNAYGTITWADYVQEKYGQAARVAAPAR